MFIYNVLSFPSWTDACSACLTVLPFILRSPGDCVLALIVHLQTKLWHLCPMGAAVRAEGSWGGIHKSVGFKLTLTLVKALHVPPLSHSFRCLNVTPAAFPGSWSSSSVGGMNANSSEQMERMWRNRTLAVKLCSAGGVSSPSRCSSHLPTWHGCVFLIDDAGVQLSDLMPPIYQAPERIKYHTTHNTGSSSADEAAKPKICFLSDSLNDSSGMNWNIDWRLEAGCCLSFIN